ncbi:MAG TPA: heavy metal-responsive transcriptional regulator [Blastocatellia bacterium]|nr:heavy metal-responsive transcriptional regulator [Blastocatellia bacterium]
MKKSLDPRTRYRVYNSGVSGRQESNGYLRSGELARLAGVSADTLRHYERKGLIAKPRRGANGYREYPPEAIDRVRLIRSALSIGFTINELARILKERDKGGAPCRSVRSLAEAKLEEIEKQLRHLTALRDDLRALVSEWDKRLATNPEGERANLLESLATNRCNKGPSPLVRPPLNRKNRNKEIDR